ncbi:MAG: hypothetical protein HZC24_11695 [Rhodocyclales bacterium]|nr:hypothetical protein [Rhodocyclales bacterium]
MKLTAILPAVLLAVATLSVGANAADADKASPADAQPAAAKMKPHSHMTEKTGAPAGQMSAAAGADGKAAKPAAGKAKVAKDRHFHPRDGK